jgi:hypothetical protein
MAWQGEIRDNQRGGTRRLYIIKDVSRRAPDGKPFYWGVSERAGLQELRRVRNGVRVYIACTGREATGVVVKGEEIFRLVFEVFAEKLDDKPVPFAQAITSSTAAPTDDVPPPGDDDVPF